MRKYPLKTYQIWIGYHPYGGQGDTALDKPLKLNEIEAPNFRVACVLHELRSMLWWIERRIANDEYVEHQSCEWFYNFGTNSNYWRGKYYETEEEASRSFHDPALQK